MNRIFTGHWRSGCWTALAVALILTSSGCSGNQRAKVRGTVNLDGKPLAGALVEFLPQGGKGQPAQGVTGSDGSFELGTLSAGDGAWPGEYKVTVTKSDIDPAQLEKVNISDPEAMQREYKKGMAQLAKPKKWQTPAIYRSADTTPLRWNVPDENQKTLELTSNAGR
jgi:hypothetical protein